MFRHHTNSVKLLLSVFGQGWPRWKWITTWKRLANVFKFCACILQKSLKTYHGLLSLQKFTWYLSLGVPGAFCVWVKVFNLNFTWYLSLGVPGAFCVWVKAFNLKFSEVLTKCEKNPRDTAPLRSNFGGIWRPQVAKGWNNKTACPMPPLPKKNSNNNNNFFPKLSCNNDFFNSDLLYLHLLINITVWVNL